MDVEVLVSLLAVAAAGAAVIPARRAMAQRRRQRLRDAEMLRLNRKLADEDVTRFGEELIVLHEETITTPLDPTMRDDYQRALDAYEEAKGALATATAPGDVTDVARRLEDGRYAYACVLAGRDGLSPPERRPPCFFDPAHGPATTDVVWSPPMGVERDIPVCFRDAERLTAGEEPGVRLVRLGNRRVPWFAAGPTYQPWALGWYGELVDSGRVRSDQLTMLFVVGGGAAGLGTADVGAAWSDPGGWSGSDMSVPDPGHDLGGYGGGFDGGGGFGGDGGGGGGGGD